jgi:hypothetical protein
MHILGVCSSLCVLIALCLASHEYGGAANPNENKAVSIVEGNIIDSKEDILLKPREDKEPTLEEVNTTVQREYSATSQENIVIVPKADQATTEDCSPPENKATTQSQNQATSQKDAEVIDQKDGTTIPSGVKVIANDLSSASPVPVISTPSIPTSLKAPPVQSATSRLIEHLTYVGLFLDVTKKCTLGLEKGRRRIEALHTNNLEILNLLEQSLSSRNPVVDTPIVSDQHGSAQPTPAASPIPVPDPVLDSANIWPYPPPKVAPAVSRDVINSTPALQAYFHAVHSSLTSLCDQSLQVELVAMLQKQTGELLHLQDFYVTNASAEDQYVHCICRLVHFMNIHNDYLQGHMSKSSSLIPVHHALIKRIVMFASQAMYFASSRYTVFYHRHPAIDRILLYVARGFPAALPIMQRLFPYSCHEVHVQDNEGNDFTGAHLQPLQERIFLRALLTSGNELQPSQQVLSELVSVQEHGLRIVIPMPYSHQNMALMNPALPTLIINDIGRFVLYQGLMEVDISGIPMPLPGGAHSSSDAGVRPPLKLTIKVPTTIINHGELVESLRRSVLEHSVKTHSLSQSHHMAQKIVDDAFNLRVDAQLQRMPTKEAVAIYRRRTKNIFGAKNIRPVDRRALSLYVGTPGHIFAVIFDFEDGLMYVGNRGDGRALPGVVAYRLRRFPTQKQFSELYDSAEKRVTMERWQELVKLWRRPKESMQVIRYLSDQVHGDCVLVALEQALWTTMWIYLRKKHNVEANKVQELYRSIRCQASRLEFLKFQERASKHPSYLHTRSQMLMLQAELLNDFDYFGRSLALLDAQTHSTNFPPMTYRHPLLHHIVDLHVVFFEKFKRAITIWTSAPTGKADSLSLKADYDPAPLHFNYSLSQATSGGPESSSSSSNSSSSTSFSVPTIPSPSSPSIVPARTVGSETARKYLSWLLVHTGADHLLDDVLTIQDSSSFMSHPSSSLSPSSASSELFKYLTALALLLRRQGQGFAEFAATLTAEEQQFIRRQFSFPQACTPLDALLFGQLAANFTEPQACQAFLTSVPPTFITRSIPADVLLAVWGLQFPQPPTSTLGYGEAVGAMSISVDSRHIVLLVLDNAHPSWARLSPEKRVHAVLINLAILNTQVGWYPYSLPCPFLTAIRLEVVRLLHICPSLTLSPPQSTSQIAVTSLASSISYSSPSTLVSKSPTSSSFFDVTKTLQLTQLQPLMEAFRARVSALSSAMPYLGPSPVSLPSLPFPQPVNQVPCYLINLLGLLLSNRNS